jgi:Na+-driven multidrug efflux pump
MQASESVVFVCFNASLLKYGGDVAVGAMTILTSVMQFALLPLQGLGQGAQPITSYNYGARNVQRVKEAVFLLLKTSIAYAVVLWLLVLFLPELFAGMFTPDPKLLAFSSQVLPVYCGAMVIFGVQTACQLTFVAIGYAGSSILVAVVRKFVLLLPLIYLMPHLTENKTLGVYMAEPVADVLAVIFTGVLFSIQFRKALHTMKDPQKGSV